MSSPVKALFAAVLAAISFALPAAAQQPGFPIVMPPGTVYGRTAISSGPGQAVPFSLLLQGAFTQTPAVVGTSPNVTISRTVNFSGGAALTQDTALLINYFTGASQTNFGFAFVSQVDNLTPFANHTNSQHVAVSGAIQKNIFGTDGSDSWAGFFQAADASGVANPSGLLTGIEIDCGTTGLPSNPQPGTTDNNGARTCLSILGRSDNTSSPSHVSSGFIINSGQAIFDNGMQLTGNYTGGNGIHFVVGSTFGYGINMQGPTYTTADILANAWQVGTGGNAVFTGVSLSGTGVPQININPAAGTAQQNLSVNSVSYAYWNSTSSLVQFGSALSIPVSLRIAAAEVGRIFASGCFYWGTSPSDCSAGNMAVGGSVSIGNTGLIFINGGSLTRNGSTGTLTLSSNAGNIVFTPAATTALTVYASTGAYVGGTPSDPGANNFEVQGVILDPGITLIGSLTKKGTVCISTTNQIYYSATTC